MRGFSLCKTLKIKNPLTKLSICDILIELLEVFGEVAQGLELPVHTRSVVSSNLTLATIVFYVCDRVFNRGCCKKIKFASAYD